MSTHYNDIIIGSGPGGYAVAAKLAATGRSVLIIEKGEQGGTCLNRGCIPTKCLCAGAETLLNIGGAEQFGIEIDGTVKADFAKAHQRMTQVVSGLQSGIDSMLKASKVTQLHATASLGPNRTVTTDDGSEFTADRILIATGSEPSRLPISGAELAMTSDDLCRLDTLPDSLVIIGGGVIGLEYASIYAAYGVEVTVVEFCKEILPNFDPDIAKRLRSMLSRRGGIKFITSAQVTGIAPGMTVTYQGKKGEETLSCQKVLMAVGRRPVTPQGLAEAGVEVDRRGYITVDSNCQTTAEGIYAAGDVTGKYMLAHTATAMAQRAMFGTEVDFSAIPGAVFTHPEAAMVGLTEAQAPGCATTKALFSANGKAQAMGQADGLVKVVYDPQSRAILGVHIVGPHAADLIAEAAVLVHHHTPIDSAAAEIIHCHPTLSETLMAAFSAAPMN